MQTFPPIIALLSPQLLAQHGRDNDPNLVRPSSLPGALTLNHVIGFAHRGAPQSRSEGNTLPAFVRALQLGALGLETDIGLTADGVPILEHTGLSLRRAPQTGNLTREQLSATTPSLRELYERCGTNFDLSVDMVQPRSVEAVVAVAQEFGAFDRLWLTYWRLPTLITWRHRWPRIHLVYPSIPVRFHAARHLIDRLADANVDVLNVHHQFCRERLVAYAHRKDVRLFAWGIRSSRPLQRVVQLGVDGVYCDQVETMVHVLRQHERG